MSATARSAVRLEAAGDHLDQARVRLAELYDSADWSADATTDAFSYRYAAVGDREMTLRTSRFEGRLEGEVPPGNEYVVQWLIRGHGTVSAGQDRVDLAHGRPVLFPEHRPFRFDYSDFDQRLVHIDRDLVDRVARERGLVAPGGLRFDHWTHPDPAAIARWQEAVAAAARMLASGSATTLLWDQTSRRTAAAFLDLYPPQSATLPATLLNPRNSHIRAAIEFVHANAHLPIGPVEMAEAANLSVRGLQVAFQRLLDTRPLVYLRQVRLDRAHDELAILDPGAVTVAEVAQRWGFGNVGRFAAAYRQRFNEYPSATLAGRSTRRAASEHAVSEPAASGHAVSGSSFERPADVVDQCRELSGTLLAQH